ncbi:conserved hypothetical protein [Culex quinquefasciatus]|uniref:Uncharacterized protein n=1 Tax=Culex quinquefasciatus TaxID=7176 RepID=B0WXF7_CULQU|nr:conserved hypothetical protein [Culex quinquefasciatus]|eukprot:XP_001862079.1 conserved hypothetical protein [Culex quinquefasciatus]
MKFTILATSLAVVCTAALALETRSSSRTAASSSTSNEGKLDQTPAEDRQWKIEKRPKAGKKIHIFLGSKTGSKTKKGKKPTAEDSDGAETQTRKTPELTTRSDKSDDLAASATSDAPDAAVGASEHYAVPEEHHQIIKEKIKIKHHHHHHHHNHVKTVVKKEPYPVEKVVQVPVEKIVHVPKPYPVEKVVEKVVHVPVEKIVHVPKPYPVEKIVEKPVHIAKPYPVEVKVPYPVEKVKVPYEVPKPVPYPVEKKIPYPVEVEKKVPVPVKVEVEKHVPYPVKVFVPYEKKVPVPVKSSSSSTFTSFPFDKDIGYSSTKLHPFESQQHEVRHYGDEYSNGEEGYRRTTKTTYKKNKTKKTKKQEDYKSQQHQQQQQNQQQQQQQQQSYSAPVTEDHHEQNSGSYGGSSVSSSSENTQVHQNGGAHYSHTTYFTHPPSPAQSGYQQQPQKQQEQQQYNSQESTNYFNQQLVQYNQQPKYGPSTFPQQSDYQNQGSSSEGHYSHVDHYGAGTSQQEVIASPPNQQQMYDMSQHQQAMPQSFTITGPTNPGGTLQLEAQPQSFQLLQLSPFQFQTPTGFSLPTAK